MSISKTLGRSVEQISPLIKSHYLKTFLPKGLLGSLELGPNRIQDSPE